MNVLLILLSLCLSLSVFPVLCRAESPSSFSVTTSEELLDAVKSVGGRGGIIRLAPGDYSISQPIEITNTNQLTFLGSGWSTVIRKKGAGDALRFVESHFCFVKDLMIVGEIESASGSGIFFTDSSSCTVDSCRICTFPESGIRFAGRESRQMSSNSVNNCHFISNKGDQLHSLYNNDFYIIGNQFGTHHGNPNSGCALNHSSAGTYSMNYHWGNKNAFRLDGRCHFNRIENNRFEESVEAGMVLGATDADFNVFNIITGNTIHTNSKGNFGLFAAVEAYKCTETTFCQNQILSWDSSSTRHKTGLVIGEGCVHWIVKDNILRHQTERALVYDENAGHIVKDNLTD